MQKTYILKNLECAACSVKIEKALNEFKEIDKCTLDFINKKLYLTTSFYTEEQEDELIAFAEKIIHIFESEVYLQKQEDVVETKISFFKSSIFDYSKMGISAFITLLFIIIKPIFIISLIGYLLAYLLISYDILIKTFKKIITGNVFDENLLMSVATICAFVIGKYPEGVMVMLLFKIGEKFQQYAVAKSKKNIEKMLSLKAGHANIIKNGEEHQIKPEFLKIGDKIIVKLGEKVPVDGVIIEGSTTLDNSMLTGESKHKKANVGTKVLSGCINMGSVITLRVQKVYDDSAVSQIIKLVESATANKPKSEQFITKFARYYTPLVMLFAVIVAFIPPIFVGEFQQWVYKSLTFLVLSCPCAIVISVPLTFFSGVGRAARYGIMVKGANLFETLTQVNTVVFDKTGTLTKGIFEVQKIKAKGIEENKFIKFLCYAESGSNHPLAKSIMKLYKEKIFQSKISNLQEIEGKGICVKVEDKNVICGSESFLKSKNIMFTAAKESGSVVHMALDGKYVGYVVAGDKVKEEAREAIEQLKKLGIKRICMLTGDKKEHTKDIAKQLGISEVYSELLPNQKLDKLNEIRKSGNGKIMYVGDGINDAPVITASDVGVAMGKKGSDIAIEVGDMVIMNDSLIDLPRSIKLARKTLRTSTENIVFALGLKLVVMILGVIGWSYLWLAVFADVGVSILAILNSMKVLYYKVK